MLLILLNIDNEEHFELFWRRRNSSRRTLWSIFVSNIWISDTEYPVWDTITDLSLKGVYHEKNNKKCSGIQ